MRILLFGTTGQVGWELRRSLQPLGDVIAVSRAAADFHDPESLRTHFAAPFDVVVNAVAYTSVDQAETDVDGAMRVNAASVAVIAREAARCGALLIHFSTDYVFDGRSDTAYTEDMPADPQSAYGRSKRAGEDAIAAAGGDHLVLRTSWVFASRGKNFVRTVLRLASERETLRIVADQHGAPTSARLIADTTAQIVARCAVERATGAFVSEILHLTASGRTTWHGFATHLVAAAQALHWPELVVRRIDAITTAEFPLPAERPANSSLSTARLARRFGIDLPDWTVGVDLVLEELKGG